MFICTNKPFAFRIARGSRLGNLARNPCFVAFCVSFVLERFRRALTLLFFGLPFTVEGVEFLGMVHLTPDPTLHFYTE